MNFYSPAVLIFGIIGLFTVAGLLHAFKDNHTLQRIYYVLLGRSRANLSKKLDDSRKDRPFILIFGETFPMIAMTGFVALGMGIVIVAPMVNRVLVPQRLIPIADLKGWDEIRAAQEIGIGQTIIITDTVLGDYSEIVIVAESTGVVSSTLDLSITTQPKNVNISGRYDTFTISNNPSFLRTRGPFTTMQVSILKGSDTGVTGAIRVFGKK